MPKNMVEVTFLYFKQHTYVAPGPLLSQSSLQGVQHLNFGCCPSVPFEMTLIYVLCGKQHIWTYVEKGNYTSSGWPQIR